MPRTSLHDNNTNTIKKVQKINAKYKPGGYMYPPCSTDENNRSETCNVKKSKKNKRYIHYVHLTF